MNHAKLDMPNIKGKQYKALINVLFVHCDRVKWRVIDDFEETATLFESIQLDCLEGKLYFHGNQPFKEYTFRFSFFVKALFSKVVANIDTNKVVFG